LGQGESITHWKGGEQNSVWHSGSEVQLLRPEAVNLFRHASDTVRHAMVPRRHTPSKDCTHTSLAEHLAQGLIVVSPPPS
jgi:hypothetical protein